MLTAGARSLLGIPLDVTLPMDLATLYDGYFAERSYRTRFGEGWSFRPRGRDCTDGFDMCLEHSTAQSYFYLDSGFRVFTDGDAAIQIASSFVSLVEADAILVGSPATGASRRGLGQFHSMEAFLTAHGDDVRGWQRAEFGDAAFGRYYVGERSVVGLSRFHSDEFLIVAIEYF